LHHTAFLWTRYISPNVEYTTVHITFIRRAQWSWARRPELHMAPRCCSQNCCVKCDAPRARPAVGEAREEPAGDRAALASAVQSTSISRSFNSHRLQVTFPKAFHHVSLRFLTSAACPLSLCNAQLSRHPSTLADVCTGQIRAIPSPSPFHFQTDAPSPPQFHRSRTTPASIRSTIVRRPYSQVKATTSVRPAVLVADLPGSVARSRRMVASLGQQTNSAFG